MIDRPRPRLSRRKFLTLTGAGAGSALLAGCDDLSRAPWFREAVLGRTDDATRAAQRAVLRDALAPEFTEADLSSHFKANGTTNPREIEYVTLARNRFADWRLDVGGLVERPQQFTLEQLRAMPTRTQITRHDCVEGWSCIGKWKGPRLSQVLNLVGLKPEARYLVFYCYDFLQRTLDNSGQYYESIDLVDAFHPQTILAYEMNDQVLPVPHGAPLRLRVERQLGYKHAKYLRGIEAVASFADIRGGQGGFWEDRGYEWYAGI